MATDGGGSASSEQRPRKRTKWDPDEVPAAAAEELPEWLHDLASAQLSGKSTQGIGPPPGAPEGAAPAGSISDSMLQPRDLPHVAPPAYMAGLPVVGGGHDLYKRVQVPAAIVGALIGKGGEGIAKMRQASGADIKLHHGEGEPFGIITISGNVTVAERVVKERIDEIIRIKNPDQFETSYVDVPQELVGQVIGAAGCNIQIMQSKCGCKIGFINIREIDESSPEDRQICRIRGPADKIPKARELVMDQMEAVRQFRMKKQMDEMTMPGKGGKGPDPKAIALRALESGKAGKGSKARLIARAQERMGITPS